MFDWLYSLLGYPPQQNSEEQLRAAQHKQYSHEEELHARRSGFDSAEAMMNWARQRNTPTGGTIPAPPQQGQGTLAGTKYLHPAESLGYTLNKYKQATDGQ